MTSSDPVTIVNAFITALNAGDAEASLAQFAEDGVVTTPDGEVLAGQEKVRGWTQTLVSRHVHFGPVTPQVTADCLAWTADMENDYLRRQNVAPLELALEAVVRDGKLIAFGGTFTPKATAKLQALREKRPG